MSVERHYFPGNNTPEGFFSYYGQILSQREADKIICIKGGPGTGKSTFLKKAGEELLKKGESVDFLHCSADDDSLDGILAADKKIAFIDGTRPHIMDPASPGAVDCILDFGKFWDEDGVRGRKDEILYLNDKKAEWYRIAYNYLKSAKAVSESLGGLYGRGIEAAEIYRIASDAIHREYTGYDITVKAGKLKKSFASAITPRGFVSFVKSLLWGMNRVYLINVPEGYKNSSFMNIALDGALYRGFNAEAFYCSMDPEHKIEHIIVPELGLAFVTANKWHDLEPWEIPPGRDGECEVIMIDLSDYMSPYYLEKHEQVLNKLSRIYSLLLKESVRALARAKEKHDELENLYMKYMDFDKINKLTEKVIRELF